MLNDSIRSLESQPGAHRNGVSGTQNGRPLSHSRWGGPGWVGKGRQVLTPPCWPWEPRAPVLGFTFTFSFPTCL